MEPLRQPLGDTPKLELEACSGKWWSMRGAVSIVHRCQIALLTSTKLCSPATLQVALSQDPGKALPPGQTCIDSWLTLLNPVVVPSAHGPGSHLVILSWLS